MRYVLSIIVLLAVFNAHQKWKYREIERAEGILAPNDPEQKNLDPTEKPSITYKDTVIDFLADYKIQARVLSTEKYWFDRGAKFSPIDLAVGWGPMSDTKNIHQLKISQADRFYFYSWKKSAQLDSMNIQTHSANMHIVPSNEWVEAQVKNLRVGQVVTLDGQLIRINDKTGSEWKSSLIRNDTGNGACELMWVTSVQTDELQATASNTF